MTSPHQHTFRPTSRVYVLLLSITLSRVPNDLLIKSVITSCKSPQTRNTGWTPLEAELCQQPVTLFFKNKHPCQGGAKHNAPRVFIFKKGLLNCFITKGCPAVVRNILGNSSVAVRERESSQGEQSSAHNSQWASLQKKAF